jgi:Tol biopolymer transport system component
MSFLGEIKRRKVFQVAAVYAVVAWLIIQVVGAIKEPLNLPDWLDAAVIVLLAVSFPIAVILAWAFDVTPEGIRTTAKTDAGHRPSGPSHTTFTSASQILILLAVGFLILDQYMFVDTRSSGVEPVAVGEENRPDMRLDVVTPPTTSPASFALSPDGRQITFVANGENGAQLWIRSLDRVEARPLAGTEGAAFPFWAPDSSAIAFFADGQVKHVSASGGQPVVVADAPSSRGGAWGADGVILFAPEPASVLLRVDTASGRAPARVTTLVNEQISHRWPRFLPDGRRFLFAALSLTGQVEGIYLGSLDGAEPVRVADGDTHAAFIRPGHLLVISRNALLAYPFDVEHATVAGEPMIVAEPVGYQANALGAFSVSRTGLLAYRSLGDSPRELVWFDRTGARVGKLGNADDTVPTDVTLAPGGELIAVARYVQGNIDIWLYDERRGFSRATDDPAIDMAPVLSPDGGQIVFGTNRSGNFGLFMKSANVSGDERPLLETEKNLWPQDWSPDGRYLLYTEESENGAADLWALPLDEEETPAVLVAQTEFDEVQGQFSPDGRWIAYASNQTGVYEIWVRPFPNPSNLRQQISTAGGTFPTWGPDGRELFFLSPDNTLMAAPRPDGQPTSAFDYLEPVPLFSTQVVMTGTNIYPAGPYSTAQYAVAEDGRFLMIVEAIDAVPPINVVLDWTAAIVNGSSTD